MNTGLRTYWKYVVFMLGWTAPDGIDCAKLRYLTTQQREPSE